MFFLSSGANSHEITVCTRDCNMFLISFRTILMDKYIPYVPETVENVSLDVNKETIFMGPITGC